MVKNGGSAQIVVILTIKKISYLVVGLYDDLVCFLCYIYL